MAGGLPSFKSLMRCFSTNAALLPHAPQQRATADEILQHPWMRENGVATDRPLDNVILQRMKCAGWRSGLRPGAQAHDRLVQQLRCHLCNLCPTLPSGRPAAHRTFANHNKLKKEAMKVGVVASAALLDSGSDTGSSGSSDVGRHQRRLNRTTTCLPLPCLSHRSLQQPCHQRRLPAWPPCSRPLMLTVAVRRRRTCHSFFARECSPPPTHHHTHHHHHHHQSPMHTYEGTITADELREALKQKGSLLKPEELQV